MRNWLDSSDHPRLKESNPPKASRGARNWKKKERKKLRDRGAGTSPSHCQPLAHLSSLQELHLLEAASAREDRPKATQPKVVMRLS